MNENEPVVESSLRMRGTINFWTPRLVEKYLRHFDLGPGEGVSYLAIPGSTCEHYTSRAKHRYTRGTIAAAEASILAEEPREADGTFKNQSLAFLQAENCGVR